MSIFDEEYLSRVARENTEKLISGNFSGDFIDILEILTPQQAYGNSLDVLARLPVKPSEQFKEESDPNVLPLSRSSLRTPEKDYEAEEGTGEFLGEGYCE